MSADLTDAIAAYEKGDFKSALRKIEPIAIKGDAEAQYYLGLIYSKGVPWRDEILFKQGVELSENFYDRGMLFDNKHPAPQDDKFDLGWYIKQAELGDSIAQNNLGVMYENGLAPLPMDNKLANNRENEMANKLAMHWYTKAADHGLAQAQYNLAVMYCLAGNFNLGIYWCTKAAEQNFAEAQFRLGVMYDDYPGIQADPHLVISWKTKAADNGHVNAQYSLGWMHQDGYLVPQDYKLSVSWYMKAAEQGCPLSKIALKGMYNEGIPDAQLISGMYGLDQIVPRNDALAFSWFSKSAEQNYAPAQSKLGRMYIDGQGVPKDS